MSAGRAILAAAAALALALATGAAPAFAHATLERTVPQRGATVHEQPRQVVFAFDEPVEANFGAVRVYDAKGARLDDDRVVHPGGSGAKIAVGVKPNLAPGTYTATYRIISADGHPVSGGLVFALHEPGAAPSKSVSELIGSTRAGTTTQIGFGVARGLQYLATAIALGTLIFLLICWRGALAAIAGRARAALLVAVGLGVVSGVAGLASEAATAGGTTFWAALDPGVIREVLGTRFGTVWGLRTIDWLVLGAAVLAFAPRDRSRVVVLLVPAALLALGPALAGHASTQSPRGLLVPNDVVHVTAMSAWLGGLAALLVLVPAATRRLEPPERTRLLAGVLVRFSPLALVCVAALLVTGTVQAYVHIRHWSALTDTAFGRAVLIKVGLLVATITLGAVNRQRVVPRLRALADGGEPPGAAGRLLRATLRAEVALVVVVLGVTSALVSYPPPTSLASGPVSAEHRLGPLELTLTVDPSHPGLNDLHLYLFRARDGTQFDGTKQLTVTAALPSKQIGALPITVRKSGPGHYVADRFTLSPGGDWQLRVTVRVSDFDQYETTVKVPVR